MLDIKALLEQHTIKIKGIIHIGAWKGTELDAYKEINNGPTVLFEANPFLIDGLKEHADKFRNVTVLNYAVSDEDGEAVFNVTSSDQSSSLLPLKRHAAYYPEITVTKQIKVRTRKLNTAFMEHGLNPQDFNFINIDIQGAELLAFKGASDILPFIDAINTEVNLEELYEECVLLPELDSFLAGYSFKRVAIITPYHPSWGDAFYVRSNRGQSPVV